MAMTKTQKNKKMLIDASHPEETRVVVVRDSKIEEFDYESAIRKQLKGNIYLAKVTRVEPSLQAAFVDYGGNRHGFLAFSEIHPDYYQIPVADREALLREEKEDAAEEEASAEAGEGAEASAAAESAEEGAEEETGEENGEEDFDAVGAEDALEEVPARRPKRRRRQYKIQEVIKRRQVLLVQVVKEERGNKGVALTTYLSLAGRYCVLMPNTARGGGISRKITDPKDRKRLKKIAQEIKVPEGMGLIIRTAGAQRTKAEIRRDFDYLMRLWENIRDLTLRSTAPTLVYEEGDLIKRAIRDLYAKDVAEVLVEGEEAHKEARAFMKMMMPSHARNVKLYKESMPLFARYKVDAQLDGLFSPNVTLPSGGYLVLNQTEALVSIDINSGKSTREHSIEDTALKTNLEAAVEIARQLRLRDLAGLIVIDFIDMEEKRNNRAVERKLKEALKGDRARIQVGRISHFGLLEMSRQRLRQGMLENATRPCPHCFGTGVIRSVSSSALSVLRGVEEALSGNRRAALTVRCNPDVAFYILNEKRDHLMALERANDVSIYIEPDREIAPAAFEIAQGAQKPPQRARPPKGAVRMDTALQEEEAQPQPPEETGGEEERKEEARRKKRRRRGRRGGRRARERAQARQAAAQKAQEETAAAEVDADAPPPLLEEGAQPELLEAAAPVELLEAPADAQAGADPQEAGADAAPEPEAAADADAEPEPEPEPKKEKKPRRPRKTRARKTPEKAADEAPETTEDAPAPAAADEAPETAENAETAKPEKPGKKTRAVRRRRTAAKKEAPAETGDPSGASAREEPGSEASAPPEPPAPAAES